MACSLWVLYGRTRTSPVNMGVSSLHGGTHPESRDWLLPFLLCYASKCLKEFGQSWLKPTARKINWVIGHDQGRTVAIWIGQERGRGNLWVYGKTIFLQLVSNNENKNCRNKYQYNFKFIYKKSTRA